MVKVLLIWPEFPPTYWSYTYSLRLVGSRCLLPPLALITVAAMLPEHWEPSLIDLNAEKLRDRDLLQCDVVFLSGMLAQRDSMHAVLRRCRELGVPTIVGGPYATAVPTDFDAATHLFVGEAEGSIPSLCEAFEAGEAPHLVRGAVQPDVTQSPVPRFDLLRKGVYFHMALQYSRGCPFSCEFCDIIVMYGRRPRVKTAEQVQRELDAIEATGFRGSVFFVDDNFIGNKKEVRRLMPHLHGWQQRHGWPFRFYTEASLNLAEDQPLMKAMAETGFESVFIGIESPSPESMAEMGKSQNLKGDLTERVHRILEHGMDVWAGFIVGFDNDGPTIFDEQIDLIERAAIPFAMVGILLALPGTALTKRLEKEGRLRPEVSQDQFGKTNFETVLPERVLLAGYAHVLEQIYEPRRYFGRILRMLEHVPKRTLPGRRKLHRGLSAIRALVTQGVLSHYRWDYLRFLRDVWRWDKSRLPDALMRAGAGHHFIEYTRHVVVPRLRRDLERLDAAPDAPPGAEPLSADVQAGGA